MVASVLVCLHLQSTMLAVLRATVTVTVAVTVTVKVRTQGSLILIHLIAHPIAHLVVLLIVYLIVVPVHDLIMVLYQSPQIALTGLVGAYIGWCLEGV